MILPSDREQIEHELRAAGLPVAGEHPSGGVTLACSFTDKRLDPFRVKYAVGPAGRLAYVEARGARWNDC